MKGNWFKCEERLAEFIHRLDVFLKALRRSERTELTVCINENRTPSGSRLAEDTRNVAGVALASGAADVEADIDVVAASGLIDSGEIAQGRVVVAACIVAEC